MQGWVRRVLYPKLHQKSHKNRGPLRSLAGIWFLHVLFWNSQLHSNIPLCAKYAWILLHALYKRPITLSSFGSSNVSVLLITPSLRFRTTQKNRLAQNWYPGSLQPGAAAIHTVHRCRFDRFFDPKIDTRNWSSLYNFGSVFQKRTAPASSRRPRRRVVKITPVKALLHSAISSATCNATLKMFLEVVAVAEVRCYDVQRNLSNLQRFVPRKPGETRYWRAGVGGWSDLQRVNALSGKIALQVARGVWNGNCKLLRLLRNVELVLLRATLRATKKICVASCGGTLLHRAILQQLCNAAVLRCKLL